MRKGYHKDHRFYRGETDLLYSKSEMTEFQKRLQESMQEMQQQEDFQKESHRQYKETMRHALKLEEEFKQLVEEMLEGINAKEASGAISSEEAEKLVEMVITRVDGADVIAGLTEPADPYNYDAEYKRDEGWETSSWQC